MLLLDSAVKEVSIVHYRAWGNFLNKLVSHWEFPQLIFYHVAYCAMLGVWDCRSSCVTLLNSINKKNCYGLEVYSVIGYVSAKCSPLAELSWFYTCTEVNASRSVC